MAQESSLITWKEATKTNVASATVISFSFDVLHYVVVDTYFVYWVRHKIDQFLFTRMNGTIH